MRSAGVVSWGVAASLLATACAAVRPKETPPEPTGQSCLEPASNPLHLVTQRGTTTPQPDPELESLLGQSSEPRLAALNRRLYLALRELDAEIRRRQALAACKGMQQPLQAQRAPDSSTGEGAQAGPVIASASGPAVAVPSTARSGGTAAGKATGGGAAAGTGAAAGAGTADGAAASAAAVARKATGATSAGGGNGATAPKIAPGSDNDVVARRLRRAAEQETDPQLRAKLWQEYLDYRQGTGAR